MAVRFRPVLGFSRGKERKIDSSGRKGLGMVDSRASGGGIVAFRGPCVCDRRTEAPEQLDGELQ